MYRIVSLIDVLNKFQFRIGLDWSICKCEKVNIIQLNDNTFMWISIFPCTPSTSTLLIWLFFSMRCACGALRYPGCHVPGTDDVGIANRKLKFHLYVNRASKRKDWEISPMIKCEIYLHKLADGVSLSWAGNFSSSVLLFGYIEKRFKCEINQWRSEELKSLIVEK